MTEIDVASARPIADGGQAFPSTVKHWNDHTAQDQSGMSLRDWFAGHVLPSIHNITISAIHAGAENFDHTRTVAEIVAADCYTYADAMLKERGKLADATP